MHRIDTLGATADNKFKEVPQPSTRVGAEWLNALQEEIVAVIEVLGEQPLNKADNGQLAAAITAHIASRIATTKASVERVITDPAGGNSPLDYGSPQQLLTVLIAMINARAGGAKAYTDHLILADEGGDATGLDYGAPAQLLNAVQRMVGLGVASTKASVERVITDPAGGNAALDYGSPQQLLTVLINMMNARVGGAKTYTEHLILAEEGGDAAGLDYGAPAQLLNAVQRMIGLGVGTTKTSVERVITDETGGNEPLDYNAPHQLLSAVKRVVSLGVGSTKASVERVITDPTGGNSPLDYGSPQQLLNVIKALIYGQAGGSKAYVDHLITAPDGGDAALDYALPAQLLQAVQRMIGLAIGSAFTLTVQGTGDALQRTISIAGGLVVIKMGYFRETIVSEVVRNVAFATPFPQACWHVFTQGVIAAPSIFRDLWPQVIPGSTTAAGFSVQFQSDDNNDQSLSGFDWWTIGN